MIRRRRFSAEYKREAVAMLAAPGVSVSQVATELGIGVTVLGRRRRKLRQEQTQVFPGQSRSRDEKVGHLRRELPESARSVIFARSGRVLRESSAMKYRMIQRCRTAFPIRMICRCLRVSSSGHDGWVTRMPSARAKENIRLLERIRALHADHDGVVGSPRIWEDLRYAGERCGRHRVARLMRRAGLHGVPQRRQWRKTPGGARPSGTRNHLDRNFSTAAPNTK